MCHALVNYVDREFAYMFLMFPFFFHVFDEFLAFRTTALVEFFVHRVLVRVYQLAHLHSEKQGLAVAFSYAETP